MSTQRTDEHRSVETLSGVVVRRPWADGSKSEHEAVCLVDGQQVVKLRRAGGNPFVDPILDMLVGQTIAAKGRQLAGQVFLMEQWDDLTDSTSTAVVG